MCDVRRAVPALLLLLLAPLAGCGGTEEQPGSVAEVREVNPDGFHGIVMPRPPQLPEQTLTDSHGQDYALVADSTSPLTLVFFGYTHCPDICPLIMGDLAAARSRLTQDLQDKVGMLFITSDPARDDPETLRAYLDRFDPSFEGLTAPIEQITRIGKAVGVEITEGDKLPSGGYAVAHGTQVLGVVPGGSAPLVWTQGTSSKDLADDIVHALTEGIAQEAQ